MDNILTLNEKLSIIALVANPEFMPKTDGELDIYMMMLKKNDIAKYHGILSRFTAANKVESAFNSAVSAFWKELNAHFPEVVEVKLNNAIRLRFNSSAKMAAFNWVATNVKFKKI